MENHIEKLMFNYHDTDKPYEVTYSKVYKNGNRVRHREDGPAVIYYYLNGNIAKELYYKEGKLHREDGPAAIKYNMNGIIDRIQFFKNNKLHNDNGPANIVFDCNGEVKRISYIKNDCWHNEDGPSTVGLFSDSIILNYYLNDIQYNPNGPSNIVYNKHQIYPSKRIEICEGVTIPDFSDSSIYQNKQLVKETYTNKYGLLHREDGPAIIMYNNGKIIKEKYYINGEEQDELTYLVKISSLENS